MNRWIALYLSGQYPGQYKLPNRFEVILKIRQIDGTNFNDSMLSLLKEKGDLEFYNTLLDAFFDLHGKENFEQLLLRLNIPKDVLVDPNNKDPFKISVNLQKLEKYITKASEEDFSRYVVMPILQAMGYENVEYKGKVNETDYGTDFYVVKYHSPSKITHFAGVQVKAKKMTDGDTSKTGSELGKLLAETKTAFSQLHQVNTGENVRITELLVFNSFDIAPSAKKKFFDDIDLQGKKIKFFAKDGVLSLISELKLKKNIFENLE